jgi:uncharacterized Ntn-hydrolase superfamily protein
MADNKTGKSRVIDVEIDNDQRPLDPMEKLQMEMASQAGDAARDAANRLAQALGAATVAGGLKAAYPFKEFLVEVGNTLGETLESVRIVQKQYERNDDDG